MYNLTAFMKNFLKKEAEMSKPRPRNTPVKPGAQARKPVKSAAKKPQVTPKMKKVWRVKQTTFGPSPPEPDRVEGCNIYSCSGLADDEEVEEEVAH
uniref:Uncharacterized protein n=1 Tax=Oryza glumipatula TaxID=40148 RepID=A0A0E0BRL5_9ORYZ